MMESLRIYQSGGAIPDLLPSNHTDARFIEFRTKYGKSVPTVQVYDDYTNPTNMINISPTTNYKIDYIMRHYNYFIKYAISKNPNILNNSDFQNFMLAITELQKKVIRSRNLNDDDFVCTGSGYGFFKIPGEQLYLDQLEAWSSIMLNKYVEQSNFRGLPLVNNFFTNNPIIAYYRYFGMRIDGHTDDSGWPVILSIKFIEELRARIEAVLVAVPEQINSKLSDVYINNLFRKKMQQINNNIENADYRDTMQLIKDLFNMSLDSIDRMKSAVGTESNIIRNMVDLEQFYEGLRFESSDLDSAVILPDSRVDLYKREDLLNERLRDLSQGSGTDMRTIAASLGRNLGNGDFANLSSTINDLITTLENANILNVNDEGLKTLKYGTVGQDASGKRFAKFMNNTDRDAWIAAKKAAQDIYTDRIVNLPYSRKNVYKVYYPYEKVHAGGSNYNTDLESQQLRLENLETELNNARTSFEQQESDFFQNMNVLDLQLLNQRNEFLIEMMNILKMIKLMILFDDGSSQTELAKLGISMDTFREKLNEMWQLMENRIPFVNDGSSLQDFFADGSLTTHDFHLFFSKLSVGVIPKTHPTNPQLNILWWTNTIEALNEKYKNIGTSADILRRIADAPPDPTTMASAKSNTDIYNEMYSAYYNLRDLKNKIMSYRYNITDRIENYNALKKEIGEIVNRNISLGTTALSEMTKSLSLFDTKSTILNDLHEELSMRRKRNDDFSMQLKRSKNTVDKYSEINKDELTEFLTNENNNLFLSNENNANTNPFDVNEIYIRYQTYINAANVYHSNINKNKQYGKNLKTAIVKRGRLEQLNKDIDVFTTYAFGNFNTIVLTINSIADTSTINIISDKLKYIINYLIQSGITLNVSMMNRLVIPEYYVKLMNSYFLVPMNIIKQRLADLKSYFSNVDGEYILPDYNLNMMDSIHLEMLNLKRELFRVVDAYETENGVNTFFIAQDDNNPYDTLATKEFINKNDVNFRQEKDSVFLYEFIDIIDKYVNDDNNGKARQPANLPNFITDYPEQPKIINYLSTVKTVMKLTTTAQFNKYIKNTSFQLLLSVNELIYNTLVEFYQTANSYVLINDFRSSNFRNVTDLQRSLSGMNNNIDKAKTILNSSTVTYPNAIMNTLKDLVYPFYQQPASQLDKIKRNDDIMMAAINAENNFKSYAEIITRIISIMRTSNTATNHPANVNQIIRYNASNIVYYDDVNYGNQILPGNKNILDTIGVGNFTFAPVDINKTFNFMNGVQITDTDYDKIIRQINTVQMLLTILPELENARKVISIPPNVANEAGIRQVINDLKLVIDILQRVNKTGSNYISTVFDLGTIRIDGEILENTLAYLVNKSSALNATNIAAIGGNITAAWRYLSEIVSQEISYHSYPLQYFINTNIFSAISGIANILVNSSPVGLLNVTNYQPYIDAKTNVLQNLNTDLNAYTAEINTRISRYPLDENTMDNDTIFTTTQHITASDYEILILGANGLKQEYIAEIYKLCDDYDFFSFNYETKYTNLVQTTVDAIIRLARNHNYDDIQQIILNNLYASFAEPIKNEKIKNYIMNGLTIFFTGLTVEDGNIVNISIDDILPYTRDIHNMNYNITIARTHIKNKININNTATWKQYVTTYIILLLHNLMKKTILIYKSNIVSILKDLHSNMNNKIKSDRFHDILLKQLIQMVLELPYMEAYTSGAPNPINELFGEVLNADAINDENAASVKFISVFEKNKTIVFNLDKAKQFERLSEICGLLEHVASDIKPTIKQSLIDETNMYETMINLETETQQLLYSDTEMINTRNSSIREVISTVSQVMFADDFLNTSFMKTSDIKQRFSETAQQYQQLQYMISAKLYSIADLGSSYSLRINQLNNYQAFVLSIGKEIQGINQQKLIYKYMSFGLIEYYLGIVESILSCIEGVPFSKLSDIEQYFKKYFYIQLKRIQKFFRWIMYDYLEEKKRVEDNYFINRTVPENYVRILRKKIELIDTSGDAKNVFEEFNELKSQLDQYQATLMPPVSLHLRINDFKLGDADPDPSDPTKYKWNLQNQVFYNEDGADKNRLLVNSNIVASASRKTAATLEKSYPEVLNKMNSSSKQKGIRFERIYNTKDYPDADIISNYMSLAPNIMNQTGTMIMTYGYSGVGKSATLFGVQANPAKGIDEKSGILQTTMDQLENITNIYFRVFEIYGLGTQFDYYWNPKANETTPNLIPDPSFYQMLIHHNIGQNGELKDYGQVPITNQYDIFSYIMNMTDPRVPPTMQTAGDTSSRPPELAKMINGAGVWYNPTYRPIDASNYRDFAKFVDTEVEPMRGSYKGGVYSGGINFTNIFTHKLLQVKGTVNNDKSSRSILVYDFQVEFTSNNGTTNYVPFIIYDLPGKEDLFKTYINPTPANVTIPDRKAFAFADIPGDNKVNEIDLKVRKSSYVLNPILVPIFDNNIDKMKNVMQSINDLITPVLLRDILDEILNAEFNSFEYDTTAKKLKDSTRMTSLSTFIPGQINSFTELFDKTKIDPRYTIAGNGIYEVFATYGFLPVINTSLAESVVSILHKTIGFITMYVLVKHRLFDVIVQIISACTSGIEGWTVEKIYAFFEAFYINENVVGLLNYLIYDILAEIKPPSRANVFKQQDKKTDIETLSTVLREFLVYEYFQDMYRRFKDYKLQFEVPIKIDEKLMEPLTVDEDQAELNRIFNSFGISTNSVDIGEFAKVGTTSKNLADASSLMVMRENQGTYNSNKIFRDGKTDTVSINNGKYAQIPPGNEIIDPKTGDPAIVKNRPLLQDFLEPYKKKISFYYVFYVVSNTSKILKAEEQLKLLNNSMPFVEELGEGTGSKETCHLK